MALADWESQFSPRAIRIHIVRRSGAPAAPHPFLGHPWCERDLDRGIAWGVLATPSITHVLRVVREQDVEDEIRCPRYLIGATGEAAARLHQDPEDPLPLRQLIFLNRDDDIRVWFLTNSGQDQLDLMRLSSHDPKTARTWTRPRGLPMAGTRFSTAPSGKSRPAQKMRHGQWRRRRSGLTRTNSYRPRQRGRLGCLLVLALSLETTAA